MKSKIKYYLNILFCLTILSCSKDSGGGSTDMTTTVVDPKDTWGNWSDWTPAFSDQTASFTQTRERSVTVNGQVDSNPPSGDASQSREITVTSSTQTVEDNERNSSVESDINNDGDQVDYVTRDITTYTASNGLGSFSVYTSDWAISFDQDSDFFTNTYGKWFTSVYDASDDSFLFYYALDIKDAAEDTMVYTAYENDDCLSGDYLDNILLAIPYESSVLLFNSPTKLIFGLYNIDASYWYGSENEGIMLDYVVSYVTGNVGGEKTIGFAEATLFAGYLTVGENDIAFPSSQLIDLFSGTMEQVQSLTICSSSSKNSNHLDTMDRPNGKEKLKKFRELNK